MPVRLLVLLVAASALVAGCESRAPDSAVTPRPAPAPSPTPIPIPTPTPLESPTTAAPSDLGLPECFQPESAATGAVVLEGDVDGDDSADEVSVLVDAAGVPDCRAFLVVRGADPLTAPIAVLDEHVLTLGLPTPNMLVEIDGAPGAEVVVNVHAGASTEFAALYTVDDGELVRMRIRKSLDDLVAFGGSVTHIEGADCAPDGRFVVAGATPRGPRRYRVVRTFHRVEGTELVPDEVERSTVRARALDSVPELSGLPFGSCR